MKQVVQLSSANQLASLYPALSSAVETIPKRSRYVIALSGGLDSMALLYFALPVIRAISSDISVVHVHHGLSVNADVWANHCREVCAQLAVPCFVEKVVVQSAGLGIEAAARDVRYAAFNRHMNADSLLLQGHHLDDQAETLVMRILKGLSGPALAGIPRQRTLATGEVYRPWLTLSKKKSKSATQPAPQPVTRDCLETAARDFGLSWVEDESNTDFKFERNRVRHQVLPSLRESWPSVVQDLGEFAERLSVLAKLNARLCGPVVAGLKSQRHPEALSLGLLASYSCAAQRVLVRYWLGEMDLRQPSAKIFERLWSELIPAAADAQPIVQWGEIQLRRYDDCLFLVRLSVASVAAEVSENIEGGGYYCELESPFQDPETEIKLALNGHYLRLALTQDGDELGPDLSSDRVRIEYHGEIKRIEIMPRQKGEYFCPAGDHRARSLTKLMQRHKIPPWRRANLPTLYINGTLYWVAYIGAVNISSVADNCPEVDAESRSNLSISFFLYLTKPGASIEEVVVGV